METLLSSNNQDSLIGIDNQEESKKMSEKIENTPNKFQKEKENLN